MFPITLEEIESAYAETGLKPIAGEWGDATHCACPMGVVAASRHTRVELHNALGAGDPHAAVGEMLNLRSGVVLAFTCGYDGSPESLLFDAEEIEAYDVGRQARSRFPGILTAESAP